MITYVNTVLVGTGTPVVAESYSGDAGKYLIQDVDTGALLAANAVAGKERIKVGLITNKTVKDMNGDSHKIVKWSNTINRADIKHFEITAYQADSEDTVYLDFSGATLTELTKGGKRILVRITSKDMPTRYRKWTDTYEYVTAADDTAAKIAAGIAKVINKAWKRSRVQAVVGSITTAPSATSTENVTTIKAESSVGAGDGKYFHEDAAATTGNVVQIVALPYNDDNAVDTINVAGKIRFSANAYYTDPAASGFNFNNKYSIDGLKITRVPGVFSTTANKLVRDREAQAMGYEGILNRGEGTWPIIKPDMNVSLNDNVHYNAITLEFENMYRAADDIFRKTKQTLEIYDYPASGTWATSNTTYASIVKALQDFVDGGKTAYDKIQDTAATTLAGRVTALETPASNG